MAPGASPSHAPEIRIPNRAVGTVGRFSKSGRKSVSGGQSPLGRAQYRVWSIIAGEVDPSARDLSRESLEFVAIANPPRQFARQSLEQVSQDFVVGCLETTVAKMDSVLGQYAEYVWLLLVLAVRSFESSPNGGRSRYVKIADPL